MVTDMYSDDFDVKELTLEQIGLYHVELDVELKRVLMNKYSLENKKKMLQDEVTIRRIQELHREKVKKANEKLL